MAEFTASRNCALPYPVYGLPYVVKFPLLDADGDPVSPSSPDSEISKNGDDFANCTNEAVEIATSSGICYLSLTGTELTADLVAVRVQSTGAKTTVLTLLPRKLVTIRSGTSASAGSSTSTIVLDASASAVDDFYNGMIVAAVIDGTTEVRMITDYNGSNQTATVVPDWNTAPDNNDTFTVYLPDGVQIGGANVQALLGTAWLTPGTAGTPDVNVKLLGGDAQSATDLKDFADAGYDPATNFIAGIAGTHNTFDDLDTAQDLQHGVTQAAVATVDTVVDGIVLQIDDLEAHGDSAWLTATGFSTHSAADVWSAGTRTLTAGTNIQLPANGLANVTAWTVGITGDITGNLSGSVGSVTTKTGFKLASDGLDLVVPADPSAIPALGTASIVTWIGYFGAWTVNEVNSDSNSVNLRNSADDADLATHATSDNGTTFSSGEPS